MRMKKLLAAGLACAALAAMLVVTVSAHGCHGGRRSGHHGGYAQNSASVPANVTVCPVDGCTAAGRHWHDGTLYCGYGHANGYCDGNCYALCPVEGCETTGRHWHDNTLYCGFDHTSGFCGGSCHVRFS